MLSGKTAVAFTSGGVLAAAGFLAALTFLPAYSGGETVVEYNGTWVVWVGVVPVSLSLVVWAGLRARCTTGSRFGTRIAVVAVAVVILQAYVMLLSAGVWLMPAAALLLLGVVTTPSPR